MFEGGAKFFYVSILSQTILHISLKSHFDIFLFSFSTFNFCAPMVLCIWLQLSWEIRGDCFVFTEKKEWGKSLFELSDGKSQVFCESRINFLFVFEKQNTFRWFSECRWGKHKRHSSLKLHIKSSVIQYSCFCCLLLTQIVIVDTWRWNRGRQYSENWFFFVWCNKSWIIYRKLFTAADSHLTTVDDA